ncbi:MAG: hypothetical protein HKL80_11830 [Acidimicrobiales bacterium]|nr:hypothetical protein [Acidimicrobiales bacterium]
MSESNIPPDDPLWMWEDGQWTAKPVTWIGTNDPPKRLDKRTPGLKPIEISRNLPNNVFYSSYSHDLNIGPGWLATGRSSKWKVLNLSSVSRVSIIAPSLANQLLMTRSLIASPPRVSFEGIGGEGLLVNADILNPSSRALIANQLPRTRVEMTDAAKAYFSSGQLPGRSGRKYQLAGIRFGSSYP